MQGKPLTMNVVHTISIPKDVIDVLPPTLKPQLYIYACIMGELTRLDQADPGFSCNRVSICNDVFSVKGSLHRYETLVLFMNDDDPGSIQRNALETLQSFAKLIGQECKEG
jgi:hypothetical protein